jgi:hypothetical protein
VPEDERRKKVEMFPRKENLIKRIQYCSKTWMLPTRILLWMPLQFHLLQLQKTLERYERRLEGQQVERVEMRV